MVGKNQVAQMSGDRDKCEFTWPAYFFNLRHILKELELSIEKENFEKNRW